MHTAKQRSRNRGGVASGDVAARRRRYDDIVKNNQASPFFGNTRGGVSQFHDMTRELIHPAATKKVVVRADLL